MAICPICKTQNKDFVNGPAGRVAVSCSVCGSLERHRELFLLIQEVLGPHTLNKGKLLHLAPEACLKPVLTNLLGTSKYITADLHMKGVTLKADVTNMQISDNTFSTVICNHMLEHIPDDIKAMKEIYRVLASDGIAIISVPMGDDVTDEDLSINTPAGRLEKYGQHDHVRLYGFDIQNRLRSVGFNVSHISLSSLRDRGYRERYRLSKSDHFFICRK